MANFFKILNKPVSVIEKPKTYPVGTYACMVDGPPTFEKIGKNQTDAAILKLKILSPGADVDPTALAAIVGGVIGKPLRHTLFLTEDAAWRAKQFLVDHLGIEPGNKSLGELFAEAPGRQVMATVRHQASTDGESIYAQVGQTAHV